MLLHAPEGELRPADRYVSNDQGYRIGMALSVVLGCGLVLGVGFFSIAIWVSSGICVSIWDLGFDGVLGLGLRLVFGSGLELRLELRIWMGS